MQHLFSIKEEFFTQKGKKMVLEKDVRLVLAERENFLVYGSKENTKMFHL
jgi:hypothetical protein